MGICRVYRMLKADPSISWCKVRLLAWNVLKKAVGLMGIGSGHLIFELSRG